MEVKKAIINCTVGAIINPDAIIIPALAVTSERESVYKANHGIKPRLTQHTTLCGRMPPTPPTTGPTKAPKQRLLRLQLGPTTTVRWRRHMSEPKIKNKSNYRAGIHP